MLTRTALATGPLILLVFGIGCGAMRTPATQPETPTAYDLSDSNNAAPRLVLPQFVPEPMLIHRGVFSPSGNEYHFTLSDAAFSEFHIWIARRGPKGWQAAEPAFYNSAELDHGTAFTSDGRFIYFASTRPVQHDDNGLKQGTWHIWRVEKTAEGWSPPRYVDIPNLRGIQSSHPTLAQDGTMYVHAGQPDYTELDIYEVPWQGQGFGPAKRLGPSVNTEGLENTPFIANDRSWLAFERDAQLFVSERGAQGDFLPAVEIKLETRGFRGNPVVTNDGLELHYVAVSGSESSSVERWDVYSVPISTLTDKLSRVSSTQRPTHQPQSLKPKKARPTPPRQASQRAGNP